MEPEQQQEQQQEPSVEQQAAEGKLGLFTPDEGANGAQKEGQEKEEGQAQGQRLSSALEEIARRDREVFDKSQALKERETELAKYKKLEEQARENPDEILRFGRAKPDRPVFCAPLVSTRWITSTATFRQISRPRLSQRRTPKRTSSSSA